MSAVINLFSLVQGSTYEYMKDCPFRDSPIINKNNNILVFKDTVPN